MNPMFADYRTLDDDPAAFPSPTPETVILCRPSMGVSDVQVISALSDWLKSAVPRRPSR